MVGPERAATKLVLPGPELTVGSAPKSLPVLYRDWHRIERQVAAIDAPWPPFREVGMAAIGLAAGAAVGWMQWGPMYDGMTIASRAVNTWQGPMLGIATVVLFAFSAVMFAADVSMRKRKELARAALIDDMREVFEASTRGEGGNDAN